MMNFIAIDFETATSKSCSACSIGLAVVENFQIVDSVSWLIRPEPFEFQPWNIKIHGIKPADVADVPLLSELWPEIYLYLQDNILVAHAAAFDMSVLRDTLNLQGINPPPFRYACSLTTARNVWPELDRHRLNLMAEHLDLRFHHHDAAEDAYASAHIMLSAAEKMECDTIEELYQKLDKPLSVIQPRQEKKKRKRRRQVHKSKPADSAL